MIRLDIAAWSDIGRQRELNEDRVFYQVLQSSHGDPVAMCAVADGMGGHLAGEVASHWVIETLKRELADQFVPPDPRQTLQMTSEQLKEMSLAAQDGLRPSDMPIMRRLREAVDSANKAVLEYGIHRPREAMGTGSTLTMAFVKGKRAYVLNVGDSRTYLLRQGQLVQLTRDHSLVAELIAAGKLAPEGARGHPQSGLITRCLGYEERLEADIKPHNLESGDWLMLCSDGLWEVLRDPALMARLIQSSSDPETVAHQLVETANQAGGKDNISVVLLRLIERADIPT